MFLNFLFFFFFSQLLFTNPQISIQITCNEFISKIIKQKKIIATKRQIIVMQIIIIDQYYKITKIESVKQMYCKLRRSHYIIITWDF